MGWVVESIYMSFCNRKLTNRGICVFTLLSDLCSRSFVSVWHASSAGRPICGALSGGRGSCYDA
ncbi:MAG: hypothetical protein ACLVEO_01580 [Lachnospiraceae bacterium]